MMGFGHLKWFHKGERISIQWSNFFQPLPLLFLAGAILLALIGWLLWLWRDQKDLIPGPRFFGSTPEGEKKFFALVPLIVAAHFAVSLIVRGVLGELFSIDNKLPFGWAHFLGLAEVFFAINLIYGAFTRFSAVGIILLWITGLFVIGIEPMLDNFYVLGIAAFFYCAGRGPYALDRLIFPRCEPSNKNCLLAVLSLRISVGASLVIVGITEKLANLPIAIEFLSDYPILNFTTSFIKPFLLSDEYFVLVIGAIEVFIGLMLIVGAFPRAIIILALIPMNLTLMVFTWNELIGHLPFYAVLAFLLIWVPRPENYHLFKEAVYIRK